MLDVLTALVVIAVLAVLFVAAVVATHDGEILRDAPADAADLRLPVGPLQPEDIAEVRFGLAVRGYRMSEVDDVLARLAQELAARDSRILRLEKALVEVVEPALEDVEERLATAPAVTQEAEGVVAVPAGAEVFAFDPENGEPEAVAPAESADWETEPAEWETTPAQSEPEVEWETEPVEWEADAHATAAPVDDDYFPELFLPEPAPMHLPDATDDTLDEAPAAPDRPTWSPSAWPYLDAQEQASRPDPFEHPEPFEDPEPFPLPEPLPESEPLDRPEPLPGGESVPEPGLADPLAEPEPRNDRPDPAGAA
jgi:DivIVA domain-containing protein